MKSHISRKILRYYSKLFEQYGYDPKSIGWGLRGGKLSLRFETLLQIGQISGCSILDVGCGFGDLYGFLKFKKIKTKYFGVEINPKLVEVGKKIYPKAKLEVRDIEKKPFNKKFDWVLASGITSHASTYPHIEGVLRAMFRSCKQGVAMNFVSDLVDYRTKGLFYSSPEKIFTIAKSLSNRIVLRHDYMSYEFTIYIYKNNKKTSNLVFKDYIGKKNFDDKKWYPKYKKSKFSKLNV